MSSEKHDPHQGRRSFAVGEQSDHNTPDTPKESADGDGEQWVTGTKLVLLCVSINLACFLMLLDTEVIATAIPQITDEFRSLADVGWYGGAYTFGSAVITPLTGKLYHYFRLKWTFAIFFLIFEIGSAICGAAQNSGMLIGGRVIAGIGAAGLLSGAITITSAAVPLHKRPPLIGMMMGIAQLGTVIGPVIGGAFTSGYTWRWCFYINLPLAALVFPPIIFLRIPEQVPKQSPLKVLPRIHHHLDLLGFALFAPAVVMLLLALQFGGHQYAWDSSQIIGLFVGSAATFIVWLVWNYFKKDDALLPVSMVSRRPVWTSALNYGLLMAVLFGVEYYLPIYFQAINNMSAVMSGVNLLPNILLQLFFVIVSGVMVMKIGRIPPFAIFSGLLAAIASGLFSTLQPGTARARRIGFQVLVGTGFGFGLQMPIVSVQNTLTEDELSVAMGFLVWAQNMGPTIFLILYNTIFNNSLDSQLQRYAPNVDAGAIIAAGATRFRTLVSDEDLPGVLRAYANSIDRLFYLAAAAGAVAFVAAFGMNWDDIRKKKKAGDSESAPSPKGEAGITDPAT